MSEVSVLRKQKPTPPSVQLWSGLFVSNWLFLWVFPVLLRAHRSQTLKFRLRSQERTAANVDALEAAWTALDTKSIRAALYTVFANEFLAIALYKISWTVFTWAGAWYLLKLILLFLANPLSPDTNGHGLALLLLATSLASSICIHQQYAESNRVALKVKAAITALVYRKSLRLSRVKGGAGEVINILSTDVTRINDAVINFHFLWAAFVEVLLILAIAFYEIRISALPALFWVLVLLPIQMFLGKRTNDLSRKQTQQTTERVHLMSEILTAIKLIKFYAWELPFTQKITAIRNKEIDLVYQNMINKSVNYTVVFAIPVLTSLSCLSMFVAIGNKLTPSNSFTILSVFNTLRYPFFMIPMAVQALAGALTAFDRLDAFLGLEEVVPLKTLDPKLSTLAIDIVDSDFRWDGAEGQLPTISKINLKIPQGCKCAIVGDVGSGKSSLLAALLGQIRQTRGESIGVYGDTAYMPQEAWLLNLPLRSNVTFGKEFKQAEYGETIRVCSLQRDLTLLLSGDFTEIAERGANLSGGQRQRVSLARAVYYDSSILLLDDPLSAVDQHVGRHIFDECFLKHLKSKTVIVALNQLQYLYQMDWIVYMHDGRIKSQGTFHDLMTNDADFGNLVNSHVTENEESDDVGEIPLVNDFSFKINVTAPPHVKKKKRKMTSADLELVQLNNLSINNKSILDALVEINENTVRSMIEKQQNTGFSGRRNDFVRAMVENEFSPHLITEAKVDEESDDDDDAQKIEKGRLVVNDESTKTTGFKDFVSYAQAGYGVSSTLSVLISFIFVHCIRLGGDFWLRLWVPRIGGYSDQVYVGVYGAFAAAFTVGVFYRGYWFTIISSFKARKLHEKLFDATMHAPMSFFDTTPVARVLAAFSKHQLHLDDTMPDAGLQAFQYFPLGLGALLICAALIPWNWVPCVCLVALGYIMLRFSTPADYATKALEAVTKPPIYSHLTATLEGLFSIRGYHAEARFDAMNIERIDLNHENLFAMQCVKSFQALYLDIISSLIIYTSALLLVVARSTPDIGSIAGLSLSNALQMLVFVQWTVRQWGEVETQMSSVGQVIYYGETKPEAPFEIPATKPPPEWPTSGLIKFQNVVLKYQKFGVSVLKNVTATIYPREKIGIVGRTGSGKSTLLVSLLRIVEPCEGKITIDDVDVSKIGLHDLRNKIAIIPQEPVMFVGTMRSNLDPFFKSSDEEIWIALDAVQLGDKIRAMPNRLETEVTENGKSVSQGQRQLLCIARAILSKAKVLVLDEATASLDAQTDFLIQETIQKNFSGLTMLTIAHRLNTIIENDRVMVMDAGIILEFDEPYELLLNPEGSFTALIEQTGVGSSKKLREIATRKHFERVEQGYNFPPKYSSTDGVREAGKITILDIAAGNVG